VTPANVEKLGANNPPVKKWLRLHPQVTAEGRKKLKQGEP